MLLVDACQVVRGNGFLALAAALLDSLETGFGGTVDVEDAGEVHDAVDAGEVVVELRVDGVFGLIEETQVPHDAGEDVAVGKQRPFRDLDAAAAQPAVLAPLGQTGHEGVDLEGEAPARGLLVVETQQVDLLLPHLLPLRQRLIQNGQFGQTLSDDLEDGGLAAADVALDGDEEGTLFLRLWRHSDYINKLHLRQYPQLKHPSIYRIGQTVVD